jgi:hypothetical protein
MKGLSTEDKDHDSDEYLNKLEMITSTCPYVKRSFAHKKHNKSTHRINNINIISNLNKSELLRLSKESPKKVHNSLKSIYRISNNKSKKDIKKILLKNQLNLDKNKKNNIYTCALMKFYESPQIKDFNFYYEIPFTGKYDFIFLLRGGLSKTEWLEKTKKIRNFPRYLKNTLFFQSQLKLQDIHKCNFSKVYDIYMAIKNKALNLYTNRQYRECLEHFNYAYGLFKWIELKDKSIKLNDISSNENFSILDDNIEEKKVLIEFSNNKKEEELYKYCLIYILEIMAYCHMELRLYSNAIECLDECATMAGNRFPDVYLRRAQARIYNRKISDEELKTAEKDINRAINLVLLHNSNIQKQYNNNSIQSNYKQISTDIYYKTKNIYNKIIQKRLETKVNIVRSLIGKKPTNENELLFDKNDNILYLNSQDNERQYKILKEIKKKYILAVKFFTETKNQAQLDLTYKEYESFYDVFNRFKSYYKFSINKIDKKVIEQLNDIEKKKLYDIKNQKLIEKNKICICEHIFIHGNYNVELYKYVVDKIFKEEKTKKMKEKKFNLLQYILNLSKGKYFIMKVSFCFIILSLVTVAFQIYYFKHFRISGITEIDK